MQHEYNDGGREAAGYKGSTGDCVTRSIAIATGKPYGEVYDALFEGIKQTRKYKQSGAGRRGTTPRNGVPRSAYDAYLKALGWQWVPTMQIGQGCKTHLTADELPKGRLIVRVSKHITAVIDGVIQDTFDPSRDGTRCVYGYWQKG